MADLVREHVGLREITRRAETFVQLVEESEVEINLPIPRTVERAGCRLREPARRLNRIAEENGTRLLVTVAKQRLPGLLRVLHHVIDHVDDFLFFGRRSDFA